MQKYPDLKDGQVTILRAEFSTGHVLDQNFILATRDDQKVYSVFDDVHEALIAAQKIVTEMSNVECIVLGRNKTLIKVVSPGS